MKLEIEIPEEKLQDSVIKYLSEYINRDNLGYWVRQEVDKVLTDNIIAIQLQKIFPNKDDIKKCFEKAMLEYVHEKFSSETYDGD